MKKVLFHLIILITIPSVAQTNNIFDELSQAKISALNFFLYQLYNETKCDIWYSNKNSKPTACMTKFPEYHKGNLIELEFLIFLNTTDEYDIQYSKLFKQSNKEKKIELLTIDFNYLSDKLGLILNRNNTTKEKFTSSGLIGDILSNTGFSKDVINSVKESVFVSVRFNYDKNHVILGKRDTNGILNIEIKQPKIIVL